MFNFGIFVAGQQITKGKGTIFLMCTNWLFTECEEQQVDCDYSALHSVTENEPSYSLGEN